MTLGYPLSSTIFSVVVDAVVRHWVEEMVESAGGQGRRGREGRYQKSLFYADDGMIASSDPGWQKGVFITLLRLFDWVGLRTNIGNIFGMVCRPWQAAGTQLEAAYKQRMTVAGLFYQEIHRVRVQCSGSRWLWGL